MSGTWCPSGGVRGYGMSWVRYRVQSILGSPQLCSGEGSAAVSCLKMKSNNVWGEPSRAGLCWGTARQVSGSWEGPEVSGPLTC